MKRGRNGGEGTSVDCAQRKVASIFQISASSVLRLCGTQDPCATVERLKPSADTLTKLIAAECDELSAL
jgi:hypothetical protein